MNNLIHNSTILLVILVIIPDIRSMELSLDKLMQSNKNPNLIEALKCNNYEAVQAHLTQHPSDANIEYGGPLRDILQKNNIKMAELLLSYGASPNIKVPLLSIWETIVGSPFGSVLSTTDTMWNSYSSGWLSELPLKHAIDRLQPERLNTHKRAVQVAKERIDMARLLYLYDGNENEGIQFFDLLFCGPNGANTRFCNKLLYNQPLVAAAADGNITEAQRLFTTLPNLEETTLALAFAAGRGKKEIVDLFLASAQTDLKPAYRVTTGILRQPDCRKKAIYEEIRRKLHDRIAPQLINALSSDETSYFKYLPAELSEPVIAYTIGKDYKFPCPSSIFISEIDDEQRPSYPFMNKSLAVVAGSGDIREALRLLNSVKYSPDDLSYALTIAALHGHEAIVNMLLQRDADARQALQIVMGQLRTVRIADKSSYERISKRLRSRVLLLLWHNNSSYINKLPMDLLVSLMKEWAN